MPGHTGGFGEPTCRHCHFDQDLDDAAGGLTLEGMPATFTPGERYLLTVTVHHPQLVAGGFQMAARYAEGPATGNNAGAFEALGTRTRFSVHDTTGTRYVSHSRDGAHPPTPGRNTWQLMWQAPDTLTAPVVFHLAANAANGDDSAFGDFIYLYNLRSSPRP